MFQKDYVTSVEGTLPISWLTKELIFQAKYTWSGWNVYYNQMHSAWVSDENKNTISICLCSNSSNNIHPNSYRELSLYMERQCNCGAKKTPVSECTTSEVKLNGQQPTA